MVRSFFLHITVAYSLMGWMVGVSTHAQVVETTPVVGIGRMSEPWWASRHELLVAAAKSHPDAKLLLVGDSITNNYDKAKLPDENFQPTWKRFYEPRKALNLGFSGDTTANVLWRLDHGEIAGLEPKVAVVLIGTNDTAFGETAEQTEAGIDAVVADLEERLPRTHLLLLGILPNGLAPEVQDKDFAVNRSMAARYGEDARVTYLDVGSVFLAKGALDADLFYDPRLQQHGRPLHPDTVGQRRLAEAVEPTLAKLMGDAPKTPLASMTDINTALTPVERLEADIYDWYARHHDVLRAKREIQPQVVLIGDSITHFWAGLPRGPRASGPTAWRRLFGETPVLNMGFGYDRVQNVLWRLRQGEFAGLRPKWVVLEVGTNNLVSTVNARANSPDEVVDGIDAICDEVARESPESRVIVMGIFPRGAQATGRLRRPIAETNRLLAKRFVNRAGVTFLDIGSQFLAPDGSLPATLMPDGVHPSEAGYEIWAEALRPVMHLDARP